MTSIHSDSQTQQNNINNNNNITILKDGPERVRQRMEELRKHHHESTDIYNKTQPLIDEQIHQETLKYLKSGQVNGTKTKSQKPRAPKRQRNPTNGNTNGISNSSTTVNLPQQTIRTSPAITSPQNGIIPQSQIQQQANLQQTNLCPQSEHLQQISPYQPINQQQTMHMQPSSQQTIFKYQATNDIYQQQPHTTIHQTQHAYQSQPSQQRTMYNVTTSHSAPQHPPPPQTQQHQPMQPSSHMHSQQHQHQLDQGHYMVHHHQGPQSQHFAQHPNQIPQQHRLSHGDANHAPFISLPNDLDLTLQAGLECDVDSLIKHEMSVEGQLEFNHDLLLKLDNHYHQPQHHNLNYVNHHL